MAVISTPPLFTEIVDQQRRITSRWYEWLINALVQRVNQGAAIVTSVSKVTQTAAIPITAFSLGTVAAGLYRITWYARITTPDGVTSSLTVRIGYTESNVPITLSGAAITGDTTTTVQSASAMIRVDQATPVTFSTAYASNKPNRMVYRVDWVVESLG